MSKQQQNNKKKIKNNNKKSKSATKEVAAKKPEPVYEEQPEMDFPARVINIKIENEQLRARLDKLE